MSTRDRTKVTSYNGVRTTSYNGYIASPSTDDVTYRNTQVTTSTMQDSISRDHRLPKPVSHLKVLPAILNGSRSASAPWHPYPLEWATSWGCPFVATVETVWSNWQCGLVSYSNYPNPAKPETPPWNEMLAELGQTVDQHVVSKTNILENVATIGQTARMVKRPFSGVQNLIKRVEGYRSLKMSEILKASSSSWLEYRYGWNPLQYSIRAVSNAWKAADRHFAYIKANRGRQCSRAVRRDYNYNYSPIALRDQVGQDGFYASGEPSESLELISSSTRYTVSLDTWLPNVVNHISRTEFIMDYLHAGDLFSLLWELTPYSFCVDWLINTDLLMASYLSARLQAPDISNICYSSKEELKYRYLGVSGRCRSWSGYYNWYSEGSGNGILESSVGITSNYERSKGLPNGQDLPGVASNVSNIHLLDASALIINALPGI